MDAAVCARAACSRRRVLGQGYPADDGVYCSPDCRELAYADRLCGCRHCGFVHEGACPSPLIEARGISSETLERIVRTAQ